MYYEEVLTNKHNMAWNNKLDLTLDPSASQGHENM